MAQTEFPRAVDQVVQQDFANAMTLHCIGDGNGDFAVIGLPGFAHQAPNCDG